MRMTRRVFTSDSQRPSEKKRSSEELSVLTWSLNKNQKPSLKNENSITGERCVIFTGNYKKTEG